MPSVSIPPPCALGRRERRPRHVARSDVNGDGRRDLVLRFRLGDTGLACGDTEAALTGEPSEGQPIEGSGSITTVECQ